MPSPNNSTRRANIFLIFLLQAERFSNYTKVNITNVPLAILGDFDDSTKSQVKAVEKQY